MLGRLAASIDERFLFIAFTVMVLLIVSRGTSSMTGAAPHYIAVTDSLFADLDVVLDNQYEPEGDYIFYPGLTVPGAAHVRVAADGTLLPGYGIGLSLLMIPAYAGGKALSATLPDAFFELVRWDRPRLVRDLASAFMALLYAAAAVMTLRVVRLLGDSAGGDYGPLAVVIAFATPPILSMSLLVYPEIPVALLTIWFAYRVLSGSGPIPASAVLAVIPWFGLRYLPITLVGAAWLIWGPRREDRNRWQALIVPAGSLLGLAMVGLWMYGSVVPLTNFDRGLSLSLNDWVLAALGLLLDPDFGLLVIAPFWGVAVAGLTRTRRHDSRYLSFAVAVFATTFAAAAATPIWWGGLSPSARLLVPTLPVLVPLLGAGMWVLANGWRRLIVFASVGWALLLAVVLVIEPVSLWTDPVRGRGLMSPRFARGWIDAASADTKEPVAKALLPEPRLVMAAYNGATARVRTLLAEGDDINAIDGNGRTALMLAASRGNTGMVSTLLEAAADVNVQDRDGWTAIMYAARAGEIRSVRRLSDTDANLQSRLGWTPLTLAALGGYTAVARSLVRAGADVNAHSHAGLTALVRAAQNDDVEMIEYLLVAGSEPETLADGRTALQWAERLGRTRAAEILRAVSEPAGR
jgi:hypothetical protein